MAKRVLLIVGGGIAAYKSLDLVRRLKERGIAVRCILTDSAEKFVTPLSFAAISGERVPTDLFSVTEEAEIGHIRLSREADLVLVAPATADLLAKMTHGLADDLATAVLLATDKPIIAAPAMNPRMWSHPATQRNVAQLRGDGVVMIGPATGEMAEAGEAGEGRMSEPADLVAAIEMRLAALGNMQPLEGHRVIVTSGPTHEPIDPVRYLANRSSGRQGHAIAAAAARAGATVTLVSGPVEIPDPPGVTTIHVETAADMMAAVEEALPAEVAICAAAVADWRPEKTVRGKIKKQSGQQAPAFTLVENPDILASLAQHHTLRPRLVIGFAAETDDVVEQARIKLGRKGSDIIVANDVSPATGVMGGRNNKVHIVAPDGVESWEEMTKEGVAEKLVALVAQRIGELKP